ncbi:MAG: gamma-glutamyltransferase [Saprospirales bacterium]|nr:MAG: gamma-glutamyltransferase [Saprospirales bacterium]
MYHLQKFRFGKARWFLFFAALLSFSYCTTDLPTKPTDGTKQAIADSLMIVTSHPLAVEAGLEIYRQGGNLFDALVGVQFALAVVYPRAGNLGGGGFAVIRTEDGSVVTQDHREIAPKAAFREMYLDSLGEVVDGLSLRGHLANGVPGTVAGLLDIYKDFGGEVDLQTVLAPAIRLAENGFLVSEVEAERLNRFQDQFRKYSTRPNPFSQKKDWTVGDRLVQPKLAKVLKAIAEKGKSGFYQGWVADSIVAEMNRGGGIITYEDLENYRPVYREPIAFDVDEFKVFSMPPPSSGGVLLQQMFHFIDEGNLCCEDGWDSESAHLLIEASRVAFALRAEHMGDPDFMKFTTDQLTHPARLDSLWHFFDPERVGEGQLFIEKDMVLPETWETTHTSIADGKGNAVALTTTLNSNYGNKVVVGGAGFFLNNEMDDFSILPGLPNQFGLLGSEINAVAPGKKMLSSMTPTIVDRDGELHMVIGSPGGPTIISAVFQVMLRDFLFDMNPYENIQKSRFHQQAFPEETRIEENAFFREVMVELREKGHDFSEIERMAVVKMIKRTLEGKLKGAGDERNPDDHAQGTNSCCDF